MFVVLCDFLLSAYHVAECHIRGKIYKGVISFAIICEALFAPKMATSKLVGELLEDVLGRVVRDSEGRSPVEKAV